MEECVEKRRELLKILKIRLEEAMSKKTTVESDYRRSRLECLDWEVLHAQCALNVEKMLIEEAAMKRQIEKSTALLTDLEQGRKENIGERISFLKLTLLSLESQQERLLFKVSIDERTLAHHIDMLEACQS
jgi:hypothetical protein